MRTSITLLLAVAASAAFCLSPTQAGAKKPLPSAFGTETAPKEAADAQDERDSAEIEGEKASKRPMPKKAPRQMRGKKVHTQLDGDEDGGGDEFGGDGF